MKFDARLLKVECKEYYPQRLVFEMMIPQNLLKKVEGLKPIHKLVDVSKDAGLLTRQELVSMMPPLLCDIRSHHSVFDMCAAPGSKTAQILEQIMNDHMHTQGKSNA
jgi:16S rRNA C967 or C1407 C5-methylase (RsmB/RsmF family)